MKNPFTASGKALPAMFRAADGCDFFNPSALKVGAVVITPIVAPIAFVAALFSPKEPGKAE
jgi:hypothetical protein